MLKRVTPKASIFAAMLMACVAISILSPGWLSHEANAASQTITYTVTSTWKDTNDQTITPDNSVIATLTMGRKDKGADKMTATGDIITLNVGNNWTSSVEMELVAEAAYGIMKIEVDGYTYNLNQDDIVIDEDNNFTAPITFKKKASSQSDAYTLNINAVFVESDGQTPCVPDLNELVVHVTCKDDDTGEVETFDETLTKSGSWSISKSLPLVTGKSYTYGVKPEFPAGFSSYSSSKSFIMKGNVTIGTNITITFKQASSGSNTLNIPVYVHWYDVDGTTPLSAVPISSLPVYLLENGTRTGNSITVSSSTWQASFTGLEHKANVSYSVTIDPMEGFNASIAPVQSGSASQGFNINLTAQASASERITTIPVSITWLDANDNPVSPDDVTSVTVYLLEGTSMNNLVRTGDSVVLNANNGWASSFADVTVRKGKAYLVEEDEVSGYQMVERGEVTEGKVDDGFTITNQKRVPITMSIPVAAVWRDTDETTPVTPDASLTVTARLFVNGEQSGNPVILSKSNNYQAVFDTFTVAGNVHCSVTCDPVSGYRSNIAPNDASDLTQGYTITNIKKIVNPPIDIPVSVRFVDTDGQTPVLPAHGLLTTFYLMNNGERTGDVLYITSDDNWASTFTGIALEDGGDYSVASEPMAGYQISVATVSNHPSDGYIATFKRKPTYAESQTRVMTGKENQGLSLTSGSLGDGSTFQWQRSTDGGRTWTNCTEASATNSKLEFTMHESSNGYRYRCMVSLNGTTIASPVTITLFIRSNNPYAEDVLTLPADLTVIEDEAFQGIDAYTVVIPDSVHTIGSRAFADCPFLRYIDIPDSVENLADDAFDGSLVIFLCNEGSASAAYAAEHSIGVNK